MTANLWLGYKLAFTFLESNHIFYSEIWIIFNTSKLKNQAELE